MERWLFILAAVMIQLRLLANMLDGMVAIEAGKASLVGELFNELPDRISDTAILVGAGYAVGSDPMLGWAAAVVALFVTYIRAMGKGIGVMGLFHGPMAKSHRMFLLTVACVYQGVAPGEWTSRTMFFALAIVILGGLVTAWRRLAKLVAAIKECG